MKKVIIILLMMGLTATAAVEVTLTIANENVNRILTAFENLSGKKLVLEIMPDDSNTPLIGRWTFVVNPKDPNETQLDFAKRFTKDLVKSSVKLYESAQAYNDYRDAISEIPVPEVNVPDDIIE